VNAAHYTVVVHEFADNDNPTSGGLRIDGMGLSNAHETAFRLFATTHRPALRQAAFLLCGDWHKADDLVQTALVKLYVAWPRVRDGRPPLAYAHQILVRCFLDEGRRPWRRESPVEVLERASVTDDAAEDALDLQAALVRLPRRQRATVLLRFWLDMSVTQTADALGCSEGTVKSQTARALTALREQLGDSALVTKESS